MAFMVFQFALRGWTEVWQRGAGVTRRTLNALLAAGYSTVMGHWHRRLRPKHFTHAGATEYGYIPRRGEDGSGSARFRGSYTQRKLRKFGHTYPLVWSGRSRQQSNTTRITATAKGGKATYNLPTLNLRPRGGRINMRAEFQEISAKEEGEMGSMFKRAIDGRIALMSERRMTLDIGA